jgi:hypothetical protein
MLRGRDDLEAKATLNIGHIVQAEGNSAESLRYTRGHCQGFGRSCGQALRGPLRGAPARAGPAPSGAPTPLSIDKNI